MLVARSEDDLRALAAELEDAQTIAEDFAATGAAQRVFDDDHRDRAVLMTCASTSAMSSAVFAIFSSVISRG